MIVQDLHAAQPGCLLPFPCLFCSSHSWASPPPLITCTQIFISGSQVGGGELIQEPMSSKKLRIHRSLPFKIDVETGSHDNPPDHESRYTKSRVDHGCDSTSVKESSYNSRERFSKGLKTEPLGEIIQAHLHIIYSWKVHLVHVQWSECQMVIRAQSSKKLKYNLWNLYHVFIELHISLLNNVKKGR